jgi:hypothetical protein
MKAATEKKFTIPKETKYKSDIHTTADRLMREDDRVVRWKLVHELLRKNNRKARKEQDKTAKECAEVRDEKLFSKKKSKTMGLRYAVAIPPITWTALVEADRLVTGHSDLANPDKEEGNDLRHTNQIAKDLERAFPQYKVS